MVWMQQLWGIHSGISLQLMFVAQDLGAIGSQMLIDSLDVPIPLYNWVGAINFFLVIVLTVGYVTYPSKLPTPSSTNKLKWNNSIVRRNEPKEHISMTFVTPAHTLNAGETTHSNWPPRNHGSLTTSRSRQESHVSNVQVQIETRSTTAERVSSHQPEVELPTYQAAVEQSALPVYPTTSIDAIEVIADDSTRPTQATAPFESWQVPPADTYVPETTAASEVQMDPGHAEQLQQIHTQMAEMLNRPIEGSIELRRSSRRSSNGADWTVKRSSYSGNLTIGPVPKWKQTMRAVMLLILQFYLFFSITVATRVCIDWSMEQLIVYDLPLKTLAVQAMFRAAGIVPLFVFSRNRYLLLCCFILMAYSMWRFHPDELKEANRYALSLNVAFGVLLLPACVLQHTQQTLEAALPVWEVAVIAFGIDFGKQPTFRLIDDLVASRPLFTCAFALVFLCIFSFAFVSIRKAVIRQHTTAGTHLN
jgi:hypothetical protein